MIRATGNVAAGHFNQENSELMLDLMTIAWQADITRVFTFMMAREKFGIETENVGYSTGKVEL
jgi:hypothetical protein